MKKRLFSLVLALILASSTILALFPSAATQGVLGDKALFASLQKISYEKQIYKTPEEKLETMTMVLQNNRYALFVQEYTAEVCVVDRITGQMLFTNPYDVADTSSSVGIKRELLSQIKLSYYGNNSSSGNLNSFLHAAEEAQINIKLIRGGVRVEYTIGEAVKKRIVPYQIEQSSFETKILKPFFEKTTKSDLSYEEYAALRDSDVKEDNDKAIDAESFDYGRFISFYSLLDLSDPDLTAREQTSILSKYPVTADMAIYILDESSTTAQLTNLEDYIRNNTEYSLEDLLNDHELVGYEMEDASPAIFKMALEYTLEEDGLQVRLPARGISFDAATYTLDTIQVLPYLGAGRTAKKDTDVRHDVGYNFVPDGSGAIIAFDQNTRYTQVSGTMYGGDFGFYNSISATTASYQTWRVPVYGTVMTTQQRVSKNLVDADGNPVLDENGNQMIETVPGKTLKHGYVAFITEGDSLARIDAVTGGTSHPYHSIGLTLFARQTDSYPLDGITVSGGAAVYTKSINRRYVGNYTVKVRLLYSNNATYVGMAKLFRQYLLDEGVLEKLPDQGTDITLYSDYIGAIDTTKKILGVPVDATADITTFENAKIIFDELKEAGIAKQAIRYLGWVNGGMTSAAPTKIKVVKELGGEEKLKELVSHVQAEGGKVYLDLNFSYVNRLSMFDGFDEEEDTVKTIDGKIAYYQTYNPIIQAFNTRVAYLISIGSAESIYEKVAERYLSLFGDGEKTLSAGSLGHALNSNQDEDFPMNRENSKEYTIQALEKITADYQSVLLEKGNYYTWKYADVVLDIPLDSSNRNTTTAEVPFLGILLHGYLNYAGEPINLAGDYEYTLLKTIENGANPYFVIAYDNVPELKVNGYSEYYAVQYSVWKETIIEEYKKLNKVLGPLQNVEIISHEIVADRVVKVGYQNGMLIYLNYNNFAVNVDGRAIRAMDFVMLKV